MLAPRDVENAELENVAPDEIGEGPDTKRQTVINAFLNYTRHLRMKAASSAATASSRGKQLEFGAEPINRLSSGIIVVFVDEVGNVVKIVVRENHDQK